MVRLQLCRFAPDSGAATSPGGGNGSCVYYLDRFYDNVHVERKGVTSLNWPKPKLKFSFTKKVSVEHHLHMQDRCACGTVLSSFWGVAGLPCFRHLPQCCISVGRGFVTL